MKILLTGGGTLGPVSALIAVAEVLRDRGAEVLLVGTPQGPDGAFVRSMGFRHAAIPVAKLSRGLTLSHLRLPVDLVRALAAAERLIRAERPGAVLGAGGFTTVPVGWAAVRRGIPLVLHQQDIVPSLTNRILRMFARRITASVPEAAAAFPADRTRVTGNPVRRSALGGDPAQGFARFGLDPRRPMVLVVGGGTGAGYLNRLIADSLPELLRMTQILHVVAQGRGEPAPSQPGYRAVAKLTSDLPDVLAAASAVICRAGFGTLSEVLQRTLPALVIPIPRSHQEANAGAFGRAGAVTVASQSSLTPQAFPGVVRSLLGEDRSELERRRTPFHWQGAAAAVAEVVLEVARG